MIGLRYTGPSERRVSGRKHPHQLTGTFGLDPGKQVSRTTKLEGSTYAEQPLWEAGGAGP